MYLFEEYTTIHTCKFASILCFVKKIIHTTLKLRKKVKNNRQEIDDVRRSSLEIVNMFTESRRTRKQDSLGTVRRDMQAAHVR